MPEWVTIMLRSIVALIIVFVIAKGAGKKQLAQLSVFEYFAVLVIAVMAANLSINSELPFTHGIIGLSIWFLIPLALGMIALKNKSVRDVVRGKGTVFIKDGKVLEDNLKKEQFSTDDLLEKLRRKNVFQVADVEFAVLETDGDLSVLPKKDKQPLTAKDLALTVASIKEPQTVIMDGKTLYEPLATAGLSKNWLDTELTKLGITEENVYLAQVDNYGQLTVDLYDDKLQVPSPQEKPLLLATMKKTQADLELFALSTENAQAKQVYTQNSQQLQTAIDKVKPFLKN